MILKSLHGLETPPSLSGNYVGRQVGRWSKQYEASKTHEIPAMDKLVSWLPGNTPQDDRTTIVHGDFRSAGMCVEG